MAKIKVLRPWQQGEAAETTEHLKVALSQLHVAKAIGGEASRLSKTRAASKSRACVPTAINQTQKENLRKFSKGKKYKSLDLCHAPPLQQAGKNLKTKEQHLKEQPYPP
ncbi:large ribosomal subunit protein uL29-like [Dama dama]|uniref:large ribosomal subunit protein uL29-like n=1 Tax=Dama dama TaxID=30532 RepID=UPI002A367EAC|nr:large ribosomal subunit protein uL29-like [Dama dama]